MKRIFLFRHGNAYDENWKQSAKSILNESGMKHAEALALRFKDFKILEAYSSTIERAMETSQIVMKYHPEVEIVYKDTLREVFDLGKPTTRESAGLIIGSFEEVRQETFEHFKSIVEHSHDGNIFVFTHGNFIRLIVLSILGAGIEGFFNLSMEFSSVTGVEVTKEGYYKLLFFNDATHTSGLPYGCPWLSDN
jgi:broad specificity phosphatase PhoE